MKKNIIFTTLALISTHSFASSQTNILFEMENKYSNWHFNDNPTLIPVDGVISITATDKTVEGETVDLTDHVSCITHSTGLKIQDNLLFGVKPGSYQVQCSVYDKTENYNITVNDVELTDLRVGSSDWELIRGKSTELEALGRFSDGAYIDITPSVSWSVGNESVLSISNGVATGIGQGSTTITAAASNGVTSWPVPMDVIESPYVSLDVVGLPHSIKVGDQAHWYVMGVDRYGRRHNVSSQISWNISDQSTIKIDPIEGLQGLKAGSTLISAKIDNIESEPHYIEVYEVVLDKLTVSPNISKVFTNEVVQLHVTGHFTDDTELNMTHQVEWKVSDKNIATVSKDGVLTTLRAGGVTLTAMKDGIESETQTIHVSENELKGINLEVIPEIISNNHAQGSEAVIRVMGQFADGSQSEIKEGVVISVSDTAIVKLDKHVVRGILPGEASLQVTVDGFSDSHSIRVKSNPGPVVTNLKKNPTMLYTSTPTVDFAKELNAGYYSTLSENGVYGPNGLKPARFSHAMAHEFCQLLSQVNYHDRSNWKLATMEQLEMLFKENRSLYLSHGWPTSNTYGTATKVSKKGSYHNMNMHTGYKSSHATGQARFVSCVSE
ncbi:Ig-like domain-containing protein [Vibrio parahaemolyticus]|nr:Ig-like domain-containing protein [Vibrio parahaemolyticus]EJF4093509.1 Ig-like domain-containing protein [Vibrio parahaemolyticus]EJG0303064.1 Ig-like domain-containing protein [Vibrio parahaemolyticus]EJG0516092.1 Ig-like domain-containing protein [Vibrio parahaemolyticus]EKN4569926.1 Ig-like domain-containing protein [Vibrio parahaemolyticus]